MTETPTRVRPPRVPPARRRRPRRRRRAVVLVVLIPLCVFLAAALGSYVRTMLRPSSLPLSIRSVEWVRSNGGAGIVNGVERWWYSHHAPKPGGPGLQALPGVGAPARHRLVAVRHWEPPPIAPALRPRLPGEGKWQPAGISIGRLAPVLMTVFRPQAEYPRLLAYVAWIDHTLTRLALYPGRYEPPSAPVRGPMQVPFGERWRLLATFNSGFTHKDGHGGFALNGRAYEALRTGDATVLGFSDGRVDVRTWTGGPSVGSDIVAARQNLPLIVDRGRPSPALDSNANWGSTLGNAVQVWRSSVGVDKRGNLLYAAANYQTAKSLANLMIRVGAVRAMELDINAEWPTFIAYGRRGGRDPVKLVPNAQQSASRFLRPDDRDFFAIYTRAGGGASVPLG